MTLTGYKIVEEISVTNRATVHRAIRESDGMAAVIKTVQRKDEDSVERCQNHYDITHDRPIRGIARAFEIITTTQSVHLVLEDAGPLNLREFINRYRPDLETMLDLATQVASALDYLHAIRTIHRDLSPENIIIRPDDTRAIVTDLGLAVTLPPGSDGYESDNVEGTLDYIAPEQTGRLQRPTETRSDLYAFGAVLYHMLCGMPPFEGTDTLEMIHAHLAKTPREPHAVRLDLPVVISKLVMLLLEKDAERRYQSAFGVAEDLKRILRTIRSGGDVEALTLDNVSTTLQFRPATALVGRDDELAKLHAAFTSVERDGAQLFLIAGTAGSGKTAIVETFVDSARGSKALFATGKYEQYGIGQPLSGLADALSGALRGLLRGTSDSVETWKGIVLEALGKDANVLSSFVPDLKLFGVFEEDETLIGAREAQIRLTNSVVRLVMALARSGQPVILMLDDLQWADEATLDVVSSLLEQGPDYPIFIIGTYRSEEDVPGVQALSAMAEDSKDRDRIHQLSVLPLDSSNVRAIISTTLDLDEDQVEVLTEVVMRRTNGHALFVQQFLAYLVENGLLRFDRQLRRWSWNAEDLRGVPLSFNVQDVIAARFDALPEISQEVLAAAACVGQEASVEVLARITGKTFDEVSKELDAVVAAGLMQVKDSHGPLRATFSHDRVQQISLESIEENQRRGLHAAIARTMLHGADSLHDVVSIYDLAHHMMEAKELLSSTADRRHMVDVLNEAAMRARNSGALSAGHKYSIALRNILGPSAWSSTTEAMSHATLVAAECAGGIGEYGNAHSYFDEYVSNTDSSVDKAYALSLKAQLLIREGRFQETLEIGVSALALLDVKLNPKVSMGAVGVQLLGAFRKFSPSKVRAIKNAPFNEDHRLKIADELLFSITSPGYNFSAALLGHITITRGNLALNSGHAPTTIDTYVHLALAFVGANMMDRAIQLADLSLSLAEKTTDDGAYARAMYMIGGHVHLWTDPIDESIEFYEKGLQHAIRSGNQFYVYWGAGLITELMMFAGKPLTEIHSTIRRLLDTLHRVYQRVDNIPWTATYFEAGVARVVHEFDLALEPPLELQVHIDAERSLIEEMRSSKDATAISSWCVSTLRIAVAKWDHDMAKRGIDLFEEFKHGAQTQWIEAEISTFKGIAFGQAIISSATIDSKQRSLLKKMASKLSKWAKRNPSTFSYRASLLKAIVHITDGKPLPALEILRDAASEARQASNMAFEGLALEWAAVAAERTAFSDIATVYRDRAARVYRLWGAVTLAEHIEHQRTSSDTRMSSAGRPSMSAPVQGTATINVLKQNIDVDSIFKASSAISGEIVHEELVRRLLSIVLENAGANIGALIMDRNGRLIVEATASTDKGEFNVVATDLDNTDSVCRSAIHLSARTGEPLVLESALHDPDFADDPYVQSKGIRSLMVIPVLHQGRRIGLLHLANTKASQAFTPERIEVIRLLTSQIAVSLENARLYEEQRMTLESAARFVPTEFLDSLGIKSIRGVGLGDAVNVKMTVLFADIRRFTTLSEQLSVDQTFAFLNQFLAAVTPAIRSNRGFIDKYVGDAIMALFPEKPDDAIAAALEILDSLAVFNNQRQKRGEPDVEIGIGIHYGEVMLGTVGTDDRMDTTVIGDTVNIAARLEELTKTVGSVVYISENVREELNPDLDVEIVKRGMEQIRGREVPLQMHEVSRKQ